VATAFAFVPAAWAGRIVFGDFAIFAVNDDGTAVTQITPYSVDADAPRWSPDGSRIVYVVRPPGLGCSPADAGCATQIWVMNADGTGQTQLATGPTRAAQPDWSSDGSARRVRPGRRPRRARRGPAAHVWVMNADGSGADQMTQSPGAREANPHFRPDGRIEFERLDVASEQPEVHVVNADGSG